jgi:hypothetical protein
MKVLIACEFSGIIREAFKRKGHDAWSCDLLDTEIQGNHIKGDVLEILNDGWDLMVAHPPCTYLCNAGVQYLKNNKERNFKMIEAKLFFLKLLNANINKICIENPVPHKYSNLPAYNQIVQPYYFGESKSKRTCLWLKNLPLLKSTNIVNKGEFYKCGNGGTNPKWYSTNSKNRSRTFQGIATAMAEQWE